MTADATGDFGIFWERLSDVVAKKIDWIAPGRLAIGSVSMLDGDPGLGKSTLVTDWAARITTGRAILDGYPRPAAGVVLLSGEDHVAATIQPRMYAAGADLSRVLYMNRVPNVGAFDGAETHTIQLPSDLVFVEAAINACGAKLVVIDPIMLFFDVTVNTNNDGSVRQALDPLKTLAERCNTSILLVRHLNKMGQGPALYRGQGSIAIGGAARIGMVVGQHPDEEEMLVLSNYKTNIGKRPKSVNFRIVSSMDNPDIGVVTYEGENNLHADDLVGYISKDEREERNIAREWLIRTMGFQPMSHTDLGKRAKTAGFSATLIRSVLASLDARRSMAGNETVWTIPVDRNVYDPQEDVPWDDEPIFTSNGRYAHA